MTTNFDFELPPPTEKFLTEFEAMALIANQLENLSNQPLRSGTGNNIFRLDSNGLYMGSATFASAPFRVTFAGALTASSATVTGSITATSGTIGGFSIGADYIRDVANSFGLASTVTGGDDVRFWAGDTFANRATAPFRATEAGVVTATNISITGGSIAGTTTVGLANLNIAARGWTQTSVFSVTDADTVAWGSGTFTTADGGTVYSISGSNTGNMVAKTYIYLDTAISTTAYQTTTTATTAVGAGKVLIAIAQNTSTEATFTVLSGQGGQNIDAANIVANSITANELSTSITYAGTIVVDTAGAIRSGQTAYNTGTGWFIGTPSGTPKFSMGDGTTANSLTWDGTNLTAGSARATGPSFLTGKYYMAPCSVATGTQAPAANQLFATPFYVSETRTFDQVAMEVTTGAAGATRIGIYKNGTAGPTNLVADFGTIPDTSGTGTKTITISQELTPGVYWLVFVDSGTPSWTALTLSAVQFAWMYGVGSAASFSGTAVISGVQVAFTYAALPSTFPGSPTYLTNTSMPAIFMRAQ